MEYFDAQKKVDIVVTSGKQFLKMGFLSCGILSMRKDANGNIILGNSPNKYEILEYNWDGPVYGTRTNTTASGIAGIFIPSIGKAKAKTTTNNIETNSTATLKFRNIKTEKTFIIGFSCNSKTDIQLQNFGVPSNKANYTDDVSQQKSNVELLKEYKELLDMGIITEDEFLEKKRKFLD